MTGIRPEARPSEGSSCLESIREMRTRLCSKRERSFEQSEVRIRKLPSQTWKNLFENHARQVAANDFLHGADGDFSHLFMVRAPAACPMALLRAISSLTY